MLLRRINSKLYKTIVFRTTKRGLDIMAEKTIKEIVELWHETQMGKMEKCMEKQHEFADLMWSLYERFYPEDDG